jgi:hypothetical protein
MRMSISMFPPNPGLGSRVESWAGAAGPQEAALKVEAMIQAAKLEVIGYLTYLLLHA